MQAQAPTAGPRTDLAGSRSSWLLTAVAGLFALQWVIFAADALLPSIVLFSYLNVPVVLAVGLGRVRVTGLLAAQALLLGAVTSAVNGYTEDANGWIRFGLMVAVSVAAIALSALVGRLTERRDQALARLNGALASEQDAHLFLEPAWDSSPAVADLRVVEANPVACTLLERDRDDLLGRGLREVLPGAVATSIFDRCAQAVASGQPLALNAERIPDQSRGTDRYFDVRGVWTGQVLSVGWRDVTDTVMARQRLEESEQRFRTAMQSAPAGMAVITLGGGFAEVNPALCRILGRRPDWLLARRMSDVLDEPDAQIEQTMRAHAAGSADASVSREHRMVRSDGTRIWVEHSIGVLRDAQGAPASYVSQFVDVTEARLARERLRFLASHDALTRLANRHELITRIEDLLARKPRTGVNVAVLFIDLDGLKPINDTYGHAAGDTVIATVAQRMRNAVRADDVVARIGGDEFVIVLTTIDTLRDATAVAEKIHAQVEVPVDTDRGAVPVTLSIGLALVEPGDDASTALKRADAALYDAKQQGRSRTVSHEPDQGP